MDLKILLPFEVYATVGDVSHIVVETPDGAFGLLPRRLDCVAAVAPGILIYTTPAAGEAYLAVDAGVLVKTGAQVLVSVRRALAGADLAELRDAVEREFLQLDEHEREVRSALAKLESGFARRFADFQRV